MTFLVQLMVDPILIDNALSIGLYKGLQLLFSM
jgi:hypothetical protein